MITVKINSLKKEFESVKDQHAKVSAMIDSMKTENYKKIVSFVDRHMDRQIFKDVFYYDIFKDIKRTSEDYQRQKSALLNVYDVHNTLQEDFSLSFDCQKEAENKHRNEYIITLQSWIEHLEYVENIQRVNTKTQALTLINKRIREKKQNWGSGEYHIWLVSGIRALEWSLDFV